MNINCADNDRGAWCKNVKVKKSLYGVGARTCNQYGYNGDKPCKFQVKHERPVPPPIRPPPIPET